MSNDNAAPPVVAGEYDGLIERLHYTVAIRDRVMEIESDPIAREAKEAADALVAMQARVSELERERDDAIEQIILVKGCANYHKSQECMEIQNEIIAQRDAAQARIAALTEALRTLEHAYLDLMETGRRRIIELGGSCDDVETMAVADPALRLSRAALKGGGT